MTLKSSLCCFGQRPPEQLRNFYNPTTPQRVHAALWNAESWSNCPRANVHRKHWGIFYKIDLHWLWISHLLLSASGKASTIAHAPPKPPSLLISPDLAEVKVMQCWHVVPAPKKKKKKKSMGWEVPSTCRLMWWALWASLRQSTEKLPTTHQSAKLCSSLVWTGRSMIFGETAFLIIFWKYTQN